MHTAMKVDPNADIRAHGVSRFRDSCYCFINLAMGVDDLQFGRTVHFEGSKAFFDQGLGPSAHVAWSIAAGPGVHAHFVAYGAA